MKTEFTDTHAHLYLKEFRNDIDEVIRRADNQGVSRIFLPNLDSSSLEELLNLCKLYPGVCYPMLGLHPTSVNGNYKKELEVLEQHLSDDRFIALGEIGIDLYWKKTFLNEQQEAFQQQLRWAKKHGLPVVIHARDSFDEIFEILDVENSRELNGVFHSFTGTLEQLNKILSYNFYVGINGIITFKNSGLAELAKSIPLERLLIETDAPFLTPAPFRGKRNESAHVSIIAAKLADLYGIELSELAFITTRNALTLFKKVN